MVLIEEVCHRVLTRSEGGPIDDSEELSLSVYKRVLHGRKFLIEPDLILFEVFTPNKAALVICLFGRSLSIGTRDFSSFDPILPNVI